MNIVENVFGLVTFEKRHLNVDAAKIPWVISSKGSQKSFERATSILVQGPFEIKKYSSDPIMEGQIQCDLSKKAAENYPKLIEEYKQFLIDQGNKALPNMKKRGGGMQDVWFRYSDGSTAIGLVEFAFDVRNAQGANAINTVAEKLGPDVSRILNCPIGARILSNRADQRHSTVEIKMPAHLSESISLLDTMLSSCDLKSESYRKLVEVFLDGVQGVVEATGNDWRSSDASILTRAFTSPLFVIEGDMVKSTVPLALGMVGRCRDFPSAVKEFDQLQLETSGELAEYAIMAGIFSVLGYVSEEGNALGKETHAFQSKSEVLPTFKRSRALSEEESKEESDKRLRVRHLNEYSERRQAIQEYLHDRDDWYTFASSEVSLDGEHTYQLPIGFSPRFVINEKSINVVPFVVEESSVVAANSYMASCIRNVDAVVEENDRNYTIEIEFVVSDDDLKTKSRVGEVYRKGIVSVHQLAKHDEKRACTAVKGFMNGVDPILAAIGIHKSEISTSIYQQCVQDGRLRPLISMDDTEKGLKVSLKVSLPKHPFVDAGGSGMADKCLDILGDLPPHELAVLSMVSGCYSTLAAHKAVGTEGINWGHMKLHVRYK